MSDQCPHVRTDGEPDCPICSLHDGIDECHAQLDKAHAEIERLIAERNRLYDREVALNAEIERLRAERDLLKSYWFGDADPLETTYADDYREWGDE